MSKIATLIKRAIVDGEELVCVAPWYWDEMNKTMEELSRATPQIDVEKIYRNSCNCEGDGGPCTDCHYDWGWNAAIDHLAASGYLRAPLERIEGLEEAIEATERANKAWLDFTGNNEIPDTAKAMMKAARAYAKLQGGNKCQH